MIHLVTLNPALDGFYRLEDPASGKIGKVLEARLEAGGKAVNIARFSRFWKTKVTTWLGTGGGSHSSHILYRALLKKEGLTARYLSAEAPIRMNVVLHQRKVSKKYNHPGFELDLSSFPRLYRAVEKGDLLVLTGRLPPGMNPTLYGAWVRAFGRRGARVMVDTSGKALAEALKAKPWFFKVNLHELSEALGRRVSKLEKVPMVQLRLNHGAVTDGARGALVWEGREVYRVKYSGRVNTPLVVGAGDAFLAGYLKAVEMKKGLKDRAALACASGAVVALHGINGFRPGLVAKALEKIWIRRIS